MTRAELARELRRQLKLVRGNTDNEDYALVWPPGCRNDLVLVLEETAAALEEEERDGRRYRLLKKAVLGRFNGSHSWCVQHEHDDKPYLMSHSEPMDEDQDMPEGEWGWYSTLDAALDAWLEEREGKGDADTQG